MLAFIVRTTTASYTDVRHVGDCAAFDFADLPWESASISSIQ
jgi:hypothetical protein